MRFARLLPPLALALFLPAAAATAAQDKSTPETSTEDTAIPTFGTTVFLSSGLKGEIYFIHHNTKDLPDLKKHKPKGTIYTTQLNVPPHDFQQGFPGITDRFEWFAIEYTGKFWIDTPGVYDFSLLADDGAQLYIDERLIIDNGGMHPPVTKDGSVFLAAGLHRIRVPYFQGPRYLVALVLKVKRRGERTFEVFNTDHFKSSSDLNTWPK